MNTASRTGLRWITHWAAVLVGYTALFTWMFVKPILENRYLIESDLYEYYLPIFLSPITTWSRFEFSGFPAFADPGDSNWYPLHFFFARIVGSWTGFAISALVVAAALTYAYVYKLTGSRRAAACAGLIYGMSEALVERMPHMATLHVLIWLPLILLAVDALRGPRPRLWVAIGAVGVAACFLGGHPQLAFYSYVVSGAYGLVGGLKEGGDRRYYRNLVLLFGLGGLMAAVKAIPLAEASTLMARQEVNFGQFVGHANSPAQMLSVLFSSIAHEGRESPTYVGLATLALGGATLGLARRHWRIGFWLVVGLVGLLMGAGDATPLAQIVYLVPLYAKFRVAARHLFLFAFASATLAGLALAALERGDLSRRSVRVATVVLLLAVALGAAVMAAAPGSFSFESRTTLFTGSWPIWNAGVWVQLGCAVATAAVLLTLRPGRWFGTGVAVLMVLLASDLLNALPYPVTLAGVTPITMPREAAAPSIHARRVRDDIAPLHQRALAIGGTHRDAVVPAAFARLWRIPIAGGYGPLLLQRYSDVATMGTNGSIRTPTLSGDDSALDLLAVKEIIVRADDLREQTTFEADGLTWDRTELGWSIGRSDCGHSYPRESTLTLPADLTVSSLALVTHLRCAEDSPQGTTVATVHIAGADGRSHDAVLRGGIETADASLRDESVRARAAHSPAVIFAGPDGGGGATYITRIDLPSALRGATVTVRVPGSHGWLVIDRLTVVDDESRARPQGAMRTWLADQTRWQEIRRLKTSRTSDRDRDEDVPGEDEYILYNNARARPRAWFVSTTVGLDDADALAAIRWSQLPDGTRFNPADTAIVDASVASGTRSFPTGRVSVDLRDENDRVSASVSSEGGGFFVLSDVFYPGWRARIDGAPADVVRTDIALQGVFVPAGQHTVTFEFASTTLRVSTAASVAAFLVCAWLAVSDLRGRPDRVPRTVAD